MTYGGHKTIFVFAKRQTGYLPPTRRLLPYIVTLVKLDRENNSSLLTDGPKNDNLDGVMIDCRVPVMNKYMTKFEITERMYFVFARSYSPSLSFAIATIDPKYNA